jgi:hypothetical protein
MREYACGRIFIACLYLGVLPPLEWSIPSFDEILSPEPKFCLLQEEHKFSTHKGVVLSF